MRANPQGFQRGGPLLDRPRREKLLFGLLFTWHDLGLAVVYSTTLAAWSYLVVSGATAQMGSEWIALRNAVPIIIWVAFMLDSLRLDRATDKRDALPSSAQALLDKPPEK